MDDIQREGNQDQVYSSLISTIHTGFPSSRSTTYILPSTFPMPLPALKHLQENENMYTLNPVAHTFKPETQTSAEVLAVPPKMPSNQKRILGEGNRCLPPPCPIRIPYPPVESSIPILCKYIIDKFRDSALGLSSPFPKMRTRKAHIHLYPNAIPYAVHSPIPVPQHEKSTVKAILDLYVQRGILIPVPLGTPVVWCALMVLGRKKDGSPRITVDYQHLNRQCFRETHHTEPPFHLASPVPPNRRRQYLMPPIAPILLNWMKRVSY